jgi:biopolymer transport protein ExbD
MVSVLNPVPMADADKEDAIVVAITRSGDVFLGQNRTTIDELGNQVREKMADNPGNKTIYIRADARA